MENALKNKNIILGELENSPFLNEVGVYQDGTVPFSRDSNGNLYAISGHSHMGHIGIFKGTSLDNLTHINEIHTNFLVGDAPKAYNSILYPEGIYPRGSIWPFGLYISKGTDRFYVLFHNESGWNAKNSAYDAYGKVEVSPKCDSDFRIVRRESSTIQLPR